MIRKLLRPTFLIVTALSVLVTVNAQKPRGQTGNAFKDSSTTPQPLYSDYKGVKIGMTDREVQAKLGTPTMKSGDQEFYVVNERETAQILYDKESKVRVVSVDYLGGVGAPDYHAIVGSEITVKADGSLYKLIRYEEQGFWVSYNRTGNSSVSTVTITIQKI